MIGRADGLVDWFLCDDNGADEKDKQQIPRVHETTVCDHQAYPRLSEPALNPNWPVLSGLVRWSRGPFVLRLPSSVLLSPLKAVLLSDSSGTSGATSDSTPQFTEKCLESIPTHSTLSSGPDRSMTDSEIGHQRLTRLLDAHFMPANARPLVVAQQEGDEQVGIYAIDTITQDRLIGTIPRLEMLSSSNSPMMELLSGTASTGMDEWPLLILTLLYEGRQGRWSSYLATLPTTFSTPMFWSEQELRELQGTSLLSKIGKEEADAMYRDQIEPILQQQPDKFLHGIEQFHRMGSLIMAYAIDLPLTPSSSPTVADQDKLDDSDEDEEVTEKLMCPLLDLLVPGLNSPASSPSNTRLVLTATEVQIYASSPIARGERLICPRDEVPNSELLRRFGYTISSNPFDTVEIQGDLVTSYHHASTSSSSSIDPTPALHTANNSYMATFTAQEKLEKEDWCLDMEILDDSFVIPSSGKVPTEMLQVLHVMALPYAAFKSLKSSLLHTSNSGPDSSTVVSSDLPKPRKTADLQRAVLGVLESRMALYTSTPSPYSTSTSTTPHYSDSTSVNLAQDQGTIETAATQRGPSLNSRNAFAVREGETAILRRAIAATQNWTVVDPADHAKLESKSESGSVSDYVTAMGHSKRSASQATGPVTSPTTTTTATSTITTSQAKRAKR